MVFGQHTGEHHGEADAFGSGGQAGECRGGDGGQRRFVGIEVESEAHPLDGVGLWPHRYRGGSDEVIPAKFLEGPVPEWHWELPGGGLTFRVVSAPGEGQITRPYFSMTGSHIVVTLSVAVRSPDGLVVFCCDVDSQRLSESRST